MLTLRYPCRKETDTIFSTRADEMMSFDFSENRSEEHLKNRRPDRILGFQETNSLSRRFAQYDLMAGQLGDDPALKILWETVESTVLNHKGNALFFPFLHPGLCGPLRPPFLTFDETLRALDSMVSASLFPFLHRVKKRGTIC